MGLLALRLVEYAPLVSTKYHQLGASTRPELDGPRVGRRCRVREPLIQIRADILLP